MGMTEELIDKLSKVSGLRVPSPTASFNYRGQRACSARDCSRTRWRLYPRWQRPQIRQPAVRVAVRLVRADNGYVIWSETYDRPLISDF